MIKRHEVQVLLSAGHSHRKTAKMAGVSKRTVTRIAQEPKIEGLDEMGVAGDRRLGRPSRTGEFREAVEALLKEEPDVPTVEILHQLKLRGYKGGKSAASGAHEPPCGRSLGKRQRCRDARAILQRQGGVVGSPRPIFDSANFQVVL